MFAFLRRNEKHETKLLVASAGPLGATWAPVTPLNQIPIPWVRVTLRAPLSHRRRRSSASDDPMWEGWMHVNVDGCPPG